MYNFDHIYLMKYVSELEYRCWILMDYIYVATFLTKTKSRFYVTLTQYLKVDLK